MLPQLQEDFSLAAAIATVLSGVTATTEVPLANGVALMDTEPLTSFGAPPAMPPFVDLGGESEGFRRMLKRSNGGVGAAEDNPQIAALYDAAKLPLSDGFQRSEMALFVWTVALMIDEWNQWRASPSGFDFNFWNVVF